MARASPQAHDTDYDGRDADEDWHEGDIEEFRPGLEPIDILSQRELNLPQLLANADHVGTEIVDRLSLLGGECDAGATALIAQFLDLVLRVFELRLEVLFGGLIFGIRVALDLIDEIERPRRGAATAQADEIVAAGQHVDRVGDEIAVIGDGDRNGLAEEILTLHPKPVFENVGVGDDHDVDRL